MSWRQFLYLCLLAFVVTLAAVIGWRLSDQAMTVIIGVVAGVAASIPTSLVVVSLALRSHVLFEPLPASAPSGYASEPAPVPPQIIVVHPAPAPAAPPAQRSLTVLPAYADPQATALNGQPQGPRQFTILGEESNS